MIERGIRHSLEQISTLNRLLILVLAILVAVCLLDIGTQKLRHDRAIVKKEDLTRQQGQSLVLETLYHGLEQKQAVLKQGLFEDYGRVGTGTGRDTIMDMAQKNSLEFDWLNEIDPGRGNGGIPVIAVSLHGDFEELRAFLLDLLAWPRVVNLPRIQVLAGEDTLDIMVNIGVSQEKTGTNGGTPP